MCVDTRFLGGQVMTFRFSLEVGLSQHFNRGLVPGDQATMAV